jgi:surface protein
MKKLLFVVICIFFFQIAKAQNEFITVWKPGNISTQNISGGIPSTSTQIWFPGRGNNFNVAWEEIGYPSHNGTLSNISSTINFLIDFGTPQNPVATDATYKVKVSNGEGSFDAIKFPDTIILLPIDSPPIVNLHGGDIKKILEVSQWGNISWDTFTFAFFNCSYLDVTATDVPDLSNVTSTEGMFFSTSIIANSSISSWNTSNVTNMRYMFAQAAFFNQPVGNWDLSNVTDIGWMFHACVSFNQPLNNWNTSKVILMDHMFHYCNGFNQDLSNWDTSKVTNMNLLLGGANIFNQKLGNWDLSSLSNGSQMLSGTNLNCSNWDQTLVGWMNNITLPSSLNIGNVSAAKYSHPSAVNARNYLLNIKGWTFSGDVYDPSCESNLSTSENISIKEISIYPNPATNFIFIKNLPKENAKYRITDFNGRLITQNILEREMISIQQLDPGNYILTITIKDKAKNFKFIKN